MKTRGAPTCWPCDARAWDACLAGWDGLGGLQWLPFNALHLRWTGLGVSNVPAMPFLGSSCRTPRTGMVPHGRVVDTCMHSPTQSPLDGTRRMCKMRGAI